MSNMDDGKEGSRGYATHHGRMERGGLTIDD
jgi:hypothetical protein